MLLPRKYSEDTSNVFRRQAHRLSQRKTIAAKAMQMVAMIGSSIIKAKRNINENGQNMSAATSCNATPQTMRTRGLGSSSSGLSGSSSYGSSSCAFMIFAVEWVETPGNPCVTTNREDASLTWQYHHIHPSHPLSVAKSRTCASRNSFSTAASFGFPSRYSRCSEIGPL